MSNNLTSANAIIMITVPGVFSSPVRMEGFSTDRAFESAAQDLGEVQMGVDGKLSAGYVPAPVDVTITLQADSGSNKVVEQWAAVERTKKTKIKASLSIIIPATGRAYSAATCYLRNWKAMPDGQKILGPRPFILACESLTSASVNA